MHIGIAGIGNMGANIGPRLMEFGHTLTVWNRTADKTRPLANAGAGTPDPGRGAARSRSSSAILTDADAIDAVYDGPQGLLRATSRQAVHRDEHGAARNPDRARRKGPRQGRGLRRMSR